MPGTVMGVVAGERLARTGVSAGAAADGPAAAERRLEEARTAKARLDREIAQTEATHAALTRDLAGAEQRLATATESSAGCQNAAEGAEAKLGEAEAQRAAIAAALGDFLRALQATLWTLFFRKEL